MVLSSKKVVLGRDCPLFYHPTISRPYLRYRDADRKKISKRRFNHCRLESNLVCFCYDSPNLAY